MPEALTIDGIPDDVYEALVRRAAVAGFAVTDYVRTELIALAGPVRRLTATEFWETLFQAISSLWVIRESPSVPFRVTGDVSRRFGL